MKYINVIFVMFMAIALIGCMDKDESGSASASIDCASVSNGGDNCSAEQTSYHIAGIKVVAAGVVTRGTTIVVSLHASNSGTEDFHGYVEAKFDAGCDGEPEWVIVEKEANPVFIPAYGTFDFSVGGQCGDMALGARTLTATLYDANWSPIPEAEGGVAKVMFELTE